MAKPHIIIISPAMAKANNGNWQTANRWMRWLRKQYQVSLLPAWDGTPADIMIALHARRSAHSIATFKAAHPHCPAILILTGTDLYRDIRTDADARHSLQLATHLVVLQEAGLMELPVPLRSKCSVIYQSAPALQPIARNHPVRHPNIIMIGHLRDEKDPITFMRAAALTTLPHLRFTHIGAALDPGLRRQAEKTQQAELRYRWLGNMPHARTRQLLKRSHIMVIASKTEGGANVITEALTSGVPVLASNIPGNRGMLGENYAGYFPVGNRQALASLIGQAVTDQAFYKRLHAQCASRSSLFSVEREKTVVLQLVDNMLANNWKIL